MHPLTARHREVWDAALRSSTLGELAVADTGVAFSVESLDGTGVRVEITADGASAGSLGAPVDVRLLGDAEIWTAFFSTVPPRHHHSIFAMRMRVPGFSIEGDERMMARYAAHLRRALELGRRAANPTADDPRPDAPPRSSGGITGRYLEVELAGRRTTIYCEQAGTGRDLIVLHTAGSDGRQAHPLMSDPRIAARFRVTAFDLPGHGRSEMIAGQLDGGYSLALDYYRDAVLAVVDALALDGAIVTGASMAGEICLELALSAPERFRGIIACEASDHVPGRRTPWITDPSVDTALYAPEWIHGLLAPTSPEALQELVLWTYSQGGYGTFAGDIDFYSGGWDARERIGALDTTITPLVMMTGEYDYSCTIEMSAATAARIPGAHFWPMPGLGHFPITENPELFVPHLLRAIEIIDADRAAVGSVDSGTTLDAGQRRGGR